VSVCGVDCVKHRTGNRYPWQMLVTCLCAFVAIASTGQFRQAYHAHDDWFMHLAIAPTRFLWYAQTEGRWITLGWSYLSRHLVPEQTFAVACGLYALSG
jgi:hypothetical protein